MKNWLVGAGLRESAESVGQREVLLLGRNLLAGAADMEGWN